MPKTPSNKKWNLKEEILVAIAKLGAILVVAIVCVASGMYCSHIYYDREAALHDALLCADAVLQGSSTTNWPTNGTLLGAARLGRFVMWDSEIDIGVLRSDSLRNVVELLATECFTYSRSVETAAPANAPRRWRMCTRRVCAEIHEFIQEGNTTLRSIDGVSPVSEMFPLTGCVVDRVPAKCPANVSFYLDAAYGANWRKESLTSLF